MTVKELRKAIEGLPDNTKVFVGSDEELNTLFRRWELAELTGPKGGYLDAVAIYGLSGSEKD
jgi:hypothetical protein